MVWLRNVYTGDNPGHLHLDEHLGNLGFPGGITQQTANLINTASVVEEMKHQGRV